MNNNLKPMVRGAYDIQKLRIQTGNRLVGNFKAKLGQEAGHPEEEMGEDEQKILLKMRASYKKLTDGVKTFPRQATFKGDEVISDYTDLCLLAQYLDLETQENTHFSRLGQVLRDYPVYTEFLEPIKGIGAAMAGVLISEIDISRAKYVSSLWMYAGLDVASDGQGRSRRKEHLVEVIYTDKDGKEATRVGITFNPWLKTKLYVLASCLIRAGNEKYVKVYRDYKHRIENHPAHIGKSKGHRDNMAKRYMTKIFLADLYAKWRELEGLEVMPPYQEAKLGHVHAA